MQPEGLTAVSGAVFCHPFGRFPVRCRLPVMGKFEHRLPMLTRPLPGASRSAVCFDRQFLKSHLQITNPMSVSKGLRSPRGALSLDHRIGKFHETGPV